MVLQIFVFSLWSNIVLPHVYIDTDGIDKLDTFCKIFLTVIAVYLILIELSAAVKRKSDYFYAPSRLFNLITPFTIIINANLTKEITQKYFWNVQVWAALTLWFRFLIYLRTTT